MAQMTGLTVENADVVRCTNIWQVVRKHLWCMTRVVLWLVFISDRSVASSSMHFSYKNHSLLLSFLYFSQKHIVRACSSYLSEICRSIPTSLVLIRSLFGSVSNFFPFLPLFFSLFYLSFSFWNPLFSFCAPVTLSKPVSLRFCHYV